jgi:hypothetical protein
MWRFHLTVLALHAVAIRDVFAAALGNVAAQRSTVGQVAHRNSLRLAVPDASHKEASADFPGGHLLCYLQQQLQPVISLVSGSSYIDCASYHHGADLVAIQVASAGKSSYGRLSVHATMGFMILLVIVPALLLPFAMYYTYTKWQTKETVEPTRTDPAKDGTGIAAITALVTYVTLLVASDTLVAYTAQSHGGQYPWNPAFLVMIIEASKFAISLVIAGVKSYVLSPSADASDDFNEEPRWFLALVAAGKLFPVAAIYAGNSCLVYVVLAEIQLDAYVVWRNTTILFNAILWTVVLHRSLSSHKWAGVAFLILGCCLNSLEMDGSLRDMIGFPIFIVLASAFLSAFAAVLNEGALKADRFKPLGIDMLNCLLYSQTAFMLLTWQLGYATYKGLSGTAELSRFAGELDRSALAIIAMQVILGLSVSRVLYYANSVAKTMAGGAREIIQVAIAPLFVASRLNSITVLSVLWITTAMFSYAAPG